MKKKISLGLVLIVILAMLSACAGKGSSERTTDLLDGFPKKNMSWIVPAGAGAPVDIPTRAIIDNMNIGTNVIVENIPGASNTIGALEASKRPADGYTILTGSSSSFVLQPLMVDLDYSPEDFRVISLLKPLSTYAVIVSPNSPLQSAEAWMDFIQSGDRFTYSVANAGNAAHLAMIDTFKKLGVESDVFVSYTGGAEVTAALLNKEIDFAVLDTPAALQQDSVGDIKVLMIMDDKPDSLAPDKPFIGDYGVEGINVYYSVQLIAMHRDTPNEIVEYVKGKINEAILTDNYQQYLINSGAGKMEITPEEVLEETLAQTRQVYAEMLKELGMIE